MIRREVTVHCDRCVTSYSDGPAASSPVRARALATEAGWRRRREVGTRRLVDLCSDCDKAWPGVREHITTNW